MKLFDDNFYIFEQKLFLSLLFLIVGEIVEFYIWVILVLRFVLCYVWGEKQYQISKLEFFVRFKVKLFWVYDNFLWFLFFFNIIKYECRYSCMDF